MSTRPLLKSRFQAKTDGTRYHVMQKVYVDVSARVSCKPQNSGMMNEGRGKVGVVVDKTTNTKDIWYDVK